MIEVKALRKKIKALVLVISGLIFVCSIAWTLYNFIRKNHDIGRLFDIVAAANSSTKTQSKNYPKAYRKDPRIEKIYALNQDVVGWVKIPDTTLDYPVFQSENDTPTNFFYHRRGVDKKYSLVGVPYIQYGSKASPLSKNVIIHGHNMGQDEVVFGVLKHYNRYDRFCNNSKDKALQFYKDHPIIEFDNLYEANQWKIFSVFIMDGEDASEFCYVKYVNEKNDFSEFVSQAEKRSLIKTAVDVNEKDTFLTLSTCSYELASGKLRLVVAARKLRPGEAKDCDVDTACTAETPLMPNCWYEHYDTARPKESEANAASDCCEAKDRDLGNKYLMVNGSFKAVEPFELICDMVEAEMGSSFPEEAIKAQAVVCHSKLLHNNKKGESPNVCTKPASPRVKKIVKKVINYGVFYDGEIAETTCYDTSAGRTNSSKDIWGFECPYLVSVKSPWDKRSPHYRQEHIYSRRELVKLFKKGLGIDLEKNNLPPKRWFKVLNRTDGGYNNEMIVAGYRQAYAGFLGRTVPITGKLIRQLVLPEIGSSKFNVGYNKTKESFKFVSFGWGHGVGLSQEGAKYLAEEKNYNFIKIIKHYFPGTQVKKLNKTTRSKKNSHKHAPQKARRRKKKAKHF